MSDKPAPKFKVGDVVITTCLGQSRVGTVQEHLGWQYANRTFITAGHHYKVRFQTLELPVVALRHENQLKLV